MIISYGKIFSKSNDGFSTLEATFYFKEEKDKLLHQKIINIRNSYIAHRGYNDFEYNTFLLDLVGTDQKCYVEISAPGLKKVGHFIEPIIMRRYLKNLYKKVIRQLALKRDKFESDIYENLGLDANLNWIKPSLW